MKDGGSMISELWEKEMSEIILHFFHNMKHPDLQLSKPYFLGKPVLFSDNLTNDYIMHQKVGWNPEAGTPLKLNNSISIC